MLNFTHVHSYFHIHSFIVSQQTNSVENVKSLAPPVFLTLVPCGDWNGHVGREAAGYEGVHGGSGYGERNADGDRVLEFAVANDFVMEYFLCQKR